jgi:LmbE family N-acetylglucosaminyl deacetylase
MATVVWTAMAELVRTVPAVALAVYAHPDDPEVACGGTLACWAGVGCEVHLVIACAGDKGTADPGEDPSRLAARRAAEVTEAAAALGLRSHQMLDHPDGEIDNTAALRETLVSVIRRLRPDAVVCPDPTAAFFGATYVNHRDHREIGWATIDAVAPAAWSPLYFPQAGAAHHVSELYLSGTLAPDAYIDVAAGIDAKTTALACHASQLRGSADLLDAALRQRAEEAGRAAGVRYAEGFRLLRPS